MDGWKIAEISKGLRFAFPNFVRVLTSLQNSGPRIICNGIEDIYSIEP